MYSDHFLVLGLFPAGAGVILYAEILAEVPLSVPRRGGGDPTYLFMSLALLFCSPQGRG